LCMCLAGGTMGTAGAIAEKFLKQKYGVEIVSTSNTFTSC
jgi:hypothetical protein